MATFILKKKVKNYINARLSRITKDFSKPEILFLFFDVVIIRSMAA